jgi:hypothetical protein
VLECSASYGIKLSHRKKLADSKIWGKLDCINVTLFAKILQHMRTG